MPRTVRNLALIPLSPTTSRNRRSLFALALLLSLTIWLALSDRLQTLPGLTAHAAGTFVVTNTNDNGAGSLRQAITDANNSPGLDTITFSIGSGVATIQLTTPLPAATDPVVIDGTTQPGYAGTPIVVLDGSLGFTGNGITLSGGDSTVRGLVINGFHNHGISITTKGGNRVEGCYIGTDVTGTVVRQNNGAGISIQNSNNHIGGTTAASRNVISGNVSNGIRINRGCCDGDTSPMSGNVIQGNYIGTNAAGTAALPNPFTFNAGILLASFNANVPVTGNVIGGTATGAGNVISGNKGEGIKFDGTLVSGNTIQGNFIGTDATGMFAISNGSDGVRVVGSNNVVGGASPAARNVISGNGINGNGTGGGNGLVVGGSDHIVQGNYVGINAAGTGAVPNLLDGIVSGGTNITIGGAGPGEGNVVAFNGLVGVLIGTTTSPGVTIRHNSIFSNSRSRDPNLRSLGIDLAPRGVTQNDAGDGDTGANGLQNFPVITSVTFGPSGTTVQGTLNSTASTNFTLDFYANSTCGFLGFGEGARHIGALSVTTNAAGDASFNSTLPTVLQAGQVITATATDQSGNTSEFSQCDATAAAVGSVGFDATFLGVNEGAGVASIIVSRTGGSTGPLSVNYSVTGQTATPDADFIPTQGTLAFTDGETSKMFTITIIDDQIANELGETILLALTTSGDRDTLSRQSTATLTINDNDPQPFVVIGDVSAAEGDSGTTDFNFALTLTGPSALPVTVGYNTTNGTATGDSDFIQLATTSVTFDPGETNKAVTVKVIGDTNGEPDETFNLNLTGASRARIDDRLGVGTILNDDVPPPASSIQLADASFSASEGTNHSVVITVLRTGSTSSAASVAYATADGTATDGDDYLSAFGTLSFAAGESSKTISVFILDDSYGEGPETFTLSLSNPVNATLGANTTATVTITSNETSNGPNPVRNSTNGVPSFNAQFFVRQHYLDFFNRLPDDSGLAFWSGQFNVCASTDSVCLDNKKADVSGAFFLSIEFQQTGFFVYRAYSAAYGPRVGAKVPLTLREFLPDTQQIGRGVVVGQGDWQAQIEANRVAFVNEFVQRPQFLAAYPLTMTPAQFVEGLAANTGGSISQAERDDLVNRLTAGTLTRAQVLRAVAEDTDFNTREKNPAFVLMQYFGYLRRNPPDAPEPTLNYQGYDFWLAKLKQFGGDHIAAQMVKAFIVSEEYKTRFGP